MFSIRRDFGFLGKLFGVPRAWLSRVGAFCSSWMVEGNLLRLTIPEFPDPVKNPIRLTIDEDALQALCGGGGTGTVQSVDGHSPDSSGAVSFGLTASRQVMTDSDGHLTTVSSEGKSTTNGLAIVTNVAWDSTNHKLTVTKRMLTFENGICTDFGTTSTTTIDTATLVTWA